MYLQTLLKFKNWEAIIFPKHIADTIINAKKKTDIILSETEYDLLYSMSVKDASNYLKQKYD